ncbi:hypothetical protein BGZ65_010476, partial [Modicella reniformis]
LHPDHQAKKTTTPSTTARTSQPKKSPLASDNHHQQQQQQQKPLHSVVSSPQNSPTNSHLSRFTTPLSSFSAAHPPDANLPSHDTDTAIENSNHGDNSGKGTTECVPVDHAVRILQSSASGSSSPFSEHLLSNNKDVTMSSGTGQAWQQQHPSQAIALTEARLFAQQVQQQQQQQNQPQGQLDSLRRISMIGTGLRSVIGGPVSSRGSTASSTVGIGGTSPGFGSGGVGGDEPTEHTLLLVRPVWVQDQDAAACQICDRTFNAVRRKVSSTSVWIKEIEGWGNDQLTIEREHEVTAVPNDPFQNGHILIMKTHQRQIPILVGKAQEIHHCRQCGRVLCNECSSRSIALPQLGYTKAVRVCNDCFDVAYLVAYCISDDLGPSTQIHGARGLRDLIKTNNEKVIEGVLTHGGLDAVVYLCNIVRGYELHALATASLAALAEHKEIQGVIVAKRAMPKLFHLVSAYTQNVIACTRPVSVATPNTKDAKSIETIVTVLMNITHVIYQMLPDKLLVKQLAREGAMDSLMFLCVYFPPGVRTRAMEQALRVMSFEQNKPESAMAATQQLDSQRSSIDGHSQQFLQGDDDQNGVDEGTLLSLNDQFHDQLENMQALAAKSISIMTIDVSNQSFIVDDPERIDRLVQLLYSTNTAVVKYASKTMAYLSLRNDRYKPDIVKGSGTAALLAVIQGASSDQALSGTSAVAESVSHACCALANLATNTESQEILMSHMDLLSVTCTAVGLFPQQREIERHVARLIANLALYEQNKLALLTSYGSASDNAGIDPADQRSSIYHHSSSPPTARRAKGNVIPTLLYIGTLTLEREDMSGLEDTSNQRHLATDDETEFFSEWATVQGMEDVQRHIVRAIDNLMTSVTEDPTSHQSFKVFSRVWPTIGLVKTIQLTNQDEDTQRRAMHVLGTLMQLQEIHADAMVAMKQQTSSSFQDNYAFRRPNDPWQEVISSTEQGQMNQVDQTNRKEETEKLEKERLEKEHLEEERLENEHLEKEHLGKERRKKERLEKQRLEKERLEKERLEKERLEEERLEQERLEKERRKKERLEKQRLEKERLEEERLEKERLEQERLEKERLEKESLEKERLDKERLEQERLEKERLELENVNEKHMEKREEAVMANADSEASNPPSKGASSSEEQTTSQEDEPAPVKDKTKKKKKKKAK